MAGAKVDLPDFGRKHGIEISASDDLPFSLVPVPILDAEPERRDIAQNRAPSSIGPDVDGPHDRHPVEIGFGFLPGTHLHCAIR